MFNVKNRFLVFPIISIVVWQFILGSPFMNTSNGLVETVVMPSYEIFKSSMSHFINVDLSFKVYVFIFSYLFGYAYGTLSTFVQSNGIVMFAIKSVLSFAIQAFAVILIVIELIFAPFIYIIKKKYKKAKIEKQKQEIYDNIRKIIQEENQNIPNMKAMED